MKGRRRLCTLVALILGVRCAISAQDASDPIELSKAVLLAAEHNDRSKLEALVISEEEFRQFVSPRLKMQNRSVPEYATYKRASNEGLDVLLQKMGGQKWKILKIAILTVSSMAQKPFPREFFGSGPNVTLETQNGHQLTLRPIGAILGHDGIYKVITYSADPKLF